MPSPQAAVRLHAESSAVLVALVGQAGRQGSLRAAQRALRALEVHDEAFSELHEVLLRAAARSARDIADSIRDGAALHQTFSSELRRYLQDERLVARGDVLDRAREVLDLHQELEFIFREQLRRGFGADAVTEEESLAHAESDRALPEPGAAPSMAAAVEAATAAAHAHARGVIEQTERLLAGVQATVAAVVARMDERARALDEAEVRLARAAERVQTIVELIEALPATLARPGGAMEQAAAARAELVFARVLERRRDVLRGPLVELRTAVEQLRLTPLLALEDAVGGEPLGASARALAEQLGTDRSPAPAAGSAHGEAALRASS